MWQSGHAGLPGKVNPVPKSVHVEWGKASTTSVTHPESLPVARSTRLMQGSILAFGVLGGQAPTSGFSFSFTLWGLLDHQQEITRLAIKAEIY